MATKAKLEGNARYLAKFKTVSARIPLEQLEVIQNAAEAAGESVSGFLISAAVKQAEGIDTNYYTVKIPKEAAEKAAEKAGKPVKAYLAEIVKKTLTE